MMRDAIPDAFCKCEYTIDGVYLGYIDAMMHENGIDEVVCRGHVVRSCIRLEPVFFNVFPLVTIRKTAAMKAIREMEWFLSGDTLCPESLQDWWKGQLSPEGHYYHGYGHQLRHFADTFDQVEVLIAGLIQHPTSRRHILTMWNPYEMASITDTNENTATPTTCHNTLAQFFVRDDCLYMNTYQRSADMLLGVPHNWVQSWALLTWIASRVRMAVGGMRWIFGDAHVYMDPSHVACAEAICAIHPDDVSYSRGIRLEYLGGSNSPFKAEDFLIVGDVPEPQVTIRPKLIT